MKESVIEKYLRDEIRKAGGRAFKFVSPGNDGVPDRLVCLPGGHVVFIETKAPGKTSTPLQQIQQERLRALGFRVEELSSKAAVEFFVLSLRAEGLLK